MDSSFRETISFLSMMNKVDGPTSKADSTMQVASSSTTSSKMNQMKMTKAKSTMIKLSINLSKCSSIKKKESSETNQRMTRKNHLNHPPHKSTTNKNQTNPLKNFFLTKKNYSDKAFPLRFGYFSR